MCAADAERVAEIYSQHARGYADFWSPVIRPVALRLLDAMPWTGANRVLDIGSGTGALVPDIQRHAPDASIIGVDRSPGMLALAAEAGTSVAVMDASNLAVRDQAVDVAIMAFVLFHVLEPVAALAEAARVLMPGGTLGTSTWAVDPMTRAAEAWDDELNAHGAIDPAPMPRANDELMNTPEKMATLFDVAGLEMVHAWVERFEHHWDLDRFVAVRTTFGTSKRKLESLAPDMRIIFLERARERIRWLSPEDFTYRGAVVCAVGRRPT
jgi:ubiquinone/menaquinone biosynthesis C-methylase UbiE